ncbi:MAG TPA: hypothetical protein VN256_19010 [Pyrinomonadaceae bacterium]|nr:hypothetical protein [Pyrinomonadaceae bacterium]
MCRLVCRRLGLCALFLCCLGATSARAAQSDVPSFIRPEHRQSVRAFLRTKPYLRVAAYADVEDKERIDNLNDGFGENKSPYYAVGDFNGDGRKDFAVAFVNTRRPKDFAVAIFNGPFGGRRSVRPAYYESNFSSDGFLLTYSEDGRRATLQVGIPGGDMTPMIKPRRRGRGYYFTSEMTQ